MTFGSWFAVVVIILFLALLFGAEHLYNFVLKMFRS